jgi:hypothetical protein
MILSASIGFLQRATPIWKWDRGLVVAGGKHQGQWPLQERGGGRVSRLALQVDVDHCATSCSDSSQQVERTIGIRHRPDAVSAFCPQRFRAVVGEQEFVFKAGFRAPERNAAEAELGPYDCVDALSLRVTDRTCPATAW